MFNKKHKIGDVISKLRKEKGWTQNELAEKLQVSDKAISKWESNKGDPSIEFLPMLAELFGVTLDYLMTGKEQEEKIVTISNLELCAKNDDVELFKELFSSHIMENHRLMYRDENNKYIFDYIFKYESKKLFTYIFTCKDFQHDISNFGDTDFFENVYYLRLLCNDTTVIRDLIRLEYKDSTVNNFRLTLNNKGFGYNGNSNIVVPRKVISDRIIDLIVSGNVDKSIYDAVTSNHSEKDFYSPALIFSYIIERVLKQKDWTKGRELLNKAITINKENFDKGKDNLEKRYSPGYNYSYYERIYIGFVQIPNSTFDVLFDEEKYELIELANQINKVANDYYNLRFHPTGSYEYYNYVATNHDIEKNKINKNKKLTESEKQKLLCLHEGILNIDEVLQLNDFKKIKKMLEEHPICYYEILSDWFEKKKYKEIYRFAIDNNLNDIADSIRYQNYKQLEEELNYIKANLYGQDIYFQCQNKRYKYGNVDFKKYEKDNYKYIEKKQKTMRKKEAEAYEELYGFTGVMADVKSKILYELSLKLDKNKITEGLNREYFENELSKGNNEIVIVKLCVKLEAILKCDFNYTGTFEEMLNKYCDRFVPMDDENYTGYDPTPNLLNKLRMKRNNIVHSEQNNVELSEENIRDCINYICKLDKEN